MEVHDKWDVEISLIKQLPELFIYLCSFLLKKLLLIFFNILSILDFIICFGLIFMNLSCFLINKLDHKT